jgi:hypothetical protein
MVRPIGKGSSEVVVVFRDAARLVTLPPGATFADLAAQVAGLEERLLGAPVSIDIRLRH